MSSVMKCDCGLYTFTWSIRNFSFCYEQKGLYLVSPKFTVHAWGETEWVLNLYPNGHDSVCYIACDLRLLSNLSIIATSTTAIVAADGLPYFSDERVNQKFPNLTFSGKEHFAKRDDIFANKEFYLPKDTLTLLCEIQILPSEKQSIKHCYIRSEIGIQHITVPWNIKRFSSLQLQQTMNFPLTLNLSNSPHFEIRVYLNGNSMDSSHLQIDIKKLGLKAKLNYPCASLADDACASLADDACASLADAWMALYECRIMMRCVVSVLDSKGIPSLTVEEMRYFFPDSSVVVWHLPKIAKLSDLLAKKDLYLPDDILSLRFELAVRNAGLQSLPAEVHAVYPEGCSANPSSTMKDDFKLLYQEQKLCDITLQTAGKTFKAHKAVLACRSPVFKAMFEHDMIENSSGIVNISDIDSKTLERMFFFMYADQMENTVDLKSAIRFYCAADKYQIHTLKECCQTTMKSLVSSENVCELLPLAYKYQDDTLKAIVKAFICKQPSEIVESDVWERLMSGECEPMLFSFVSPSEQLPQSSATLSEPVQQFSISNGLSSVTPSEPAPPFSLMSQGSSSDSNASNKVMPERTAKRKRKV